MTEWVGRKEFKLSKIDYEPKKKARAINISAFGIFTSINLSVLLISFLEPYGNSARWLMPSPYFLQSIGNLTDSTGFGNLFNA